jgi:DNA-binding NarL/FixJ family response regulator
LSKVRVLLADDHRSMREYAARVLEPEYQIVAAAENGSEALSAVETFHPDVLVLDISMPGLSGFDVAQALRDDPRAPAIVFLTVYEDDEFVQVAETLGATAYVVKSRLDSDLLRAVALAVEGRRFVSVR